MENVKNLKLRSEEVQEIITDVPSWLIRNGVILILFIIVALLLGAYFFRYPDIVYSKITIVSENPPIPVMAKVNGKLQVLLAKDKEVVKSGQIIAIIENAAKYTDVYAIKEKIKHIDLTAEKMDMQFLRKSEDELGMVYSSYSQFLSAFDAMSRFMQFDPHGGKMRRLKQQVIQSQSYLNQLNNSGNVLAKDLALARKQLRRDSVLHKNQVIADNDYERSYSNFLKQEFSYKNVLLEIASSKMKIQQLLHQIDDLGNERSETKTKLIDDLMLARDNLNTSIITWEQNYVLKAPIDGAISFNTIYIENQFINSNNSVFTIVPTDQARIVGRVLLQMSRSGKVSIGQKVNVKLDNFPYMEFGIVKGTIENISLVPFSNSDGFFYTATVSFPNGLKSNLKKDLQFSQETQGIAEIITKDRRFIERIVEPFVVLMNK